MEPEMFNVNSTSNFPPYFLRFAENLRSIFDGLYDGIITIDTTGKIQQFNKSAEKMTGFPGEEALDKQLHEVLISRHERRFTDKVVAAIGQGRQIKDYDLDITTKDGRTKTINITSSFLIGLYEDEPSGVVICFSYVT